MTLRRSRRGPAPLPALLLLWAPAAAGADPVSIVFQAVPPPIEIANDGQQYTHTTQAHLPYPVAYEISCPGGEKVAHALLAAGPNQVTTHGGNLSPEPYAWTLANPGGAAHVWSVPVAELFPPVFTKNPAERCNQELARRVQAGQLASQVLGSTFELPYTHEVYAVVQCVDEGTVVEALGGTWPEFTHGWSHAVDQRLGVIRCKGSAGLQAEPPPPKPVPGTTGGGGKLSGPRRPEDPAGRVDEPGEPGTGGDGGDLVGPRRPEDPAAGRSEPEEPGPRMRRR